MGCGLGSERDGDGARNALTPTFSDQKNMLAALKLAIFSATPALVANFLSILPMLFLLQLVVATSSSTE